MAVQCPWCQQPLPDDMAEAEWDHIIPKLWGGPDDPWNRQYLHPQCNRRKGGTLTAHARTLAAKHGFTLVRRAPLPDPAGQPGWALELLMVIQGLSGEIARNPAILRDLHDVDGLLRDSANLGIYKAWQKKRCSAVRIAELLGVSKPAAWRRIKVGEVIAQTETATRAKEQRDADAARLAAVGTQGFDRR